MLFEKKRIFMLERDNFKYLKFFSTLNKALRYQDSRRLLMILWLIGTIKALKKKLNCFDVLITNERSIL